MNIAKLDESSIKNSKKLIRRVLSASIDNPNNPESLNFFQADTYRFYFLMSFMWESFEGNEISQEYAISLVPKKFASRIKRLQVLKQAVQLDYISRNLLKLIKEEEYTFLLKFFLMTLFNTRMTLINQFSKIKALNIVFHSLTR